MRARQRDPATRNHRRVSIFGGKSVTMSRSNRSRQRWPGRISIGSFGNAAASFSGDAAVRQPATLSGRGSNPARQDGAHPRSTRLRNVCDLRCSFRPLNADEGIKWRAPNCSGPTSSRQSGRRFLRRDRIGALGAQACALRNSSLFFEGLRKITAFFDDFRSGANETKRSISQQIEASRNCFGNASSPQRVKAGDSSSTIRDPLCRRRAIRHCRRSANCVTYGC